MKRFLNHFSLFVLIFAMSLFSNVVKAEEIVNPFANETNPDVFLGEKVVSDNLITTPEIKVDTKKETVQLNAPFILYPKQNAKVGYDTEIKGLAISESLVKVYINGNYDGEIQTWKSKTDLSAFYYQPKQKLQKGNNVVKVIASKNGVTSAFSKEITFTKEDAYPAPTAIMPYSYKDEPSTFVLRGLAKSGDTIQIFLGNKIIKTLKTSESSTGVSGFRYVVIGLGYGYHSVYFKSISKDGKLSGPSKKLYFKVEVLDEVAPFANETKIDKQIDKTQETKKDTKTEVKTEPKKDSVKKDNTVKNEELKKEEIKSTDNVKVEDNSTNQKTEKKSSPINKSMVTGIILLSLAVLLVIVWLVIENKEKIKNALDKFFDEDEENKK